MKKPSQITMVHKKDLPWEDPFIGSLNELIEVLQDLVTQYPEAGKEGVRIEENWKACDKCSDLKLTNHWIHSKTCIDYHPSGSSGYEQSGCIIPRGGELK